MSFIGNLLWFLLGGFAISLGWLLIGILWCVSIIGIPIGIQCFKFAKLSIFPFGKEVRYGGGPASTILNLLWLIFGGIPLAALASAVACVLCLTIVGIPFGKQCFKIAKLALMPFGANVY